MGNGHFKVLFANEVGFCQAKWTVTIGFFISWFKSVSSFIGFFKKSD